MRIIGACSEEVIADHEHGGGRPHWAILEDLGARIGLSRTTMRKAPLLASTQLCWLAWEALMSNRHWLEGLIANTCAERTNIPGYGTGLIQRRGWFGLERQRWGRLFKLSNDELDFFELHEEAFLADVRVQRIEHLALLGVLRLNVPLTKRRCAQIDERMAERFTAKAAGGGFDGCRGHSH